MKKEKPGSIDWFRSKVAPDLDRSLYIGLPIERHKVDLDREATLWFIWDMSKMEMGLQSGNMNGMSNQSSAENYYIFYNMIEHRWRDAILIVVGSVVSAFNRTGRSHPQNSPLLTMFVPLEFKDGDYYSRIMLYPRHGKKTGHLSLVYDVSCLRIKPQQSENIYYKLGEAIMSNSDLLRNISADIHTMVRALLALAPREYIILEYLSENPLSSNRDLAVKYKISVTTMNKHASNIVKKCERYFNLRFNDVREVSKFLFEAGLI